MIQAIQSHIKQNNVQLPTQQRNYALFDTNKVDSIVAKKEQGLAYVKDVLEKSNDEKEIVEALYITDRMLDNGVKGIAGMYPLLSKFNDTKSPNIQTFLAGIYRKTQVPDAFGPLVAMLIKNSQPSTSLLPKEKITFDPNEEIGGAILEYIRNYSHNPKKIDYTA